MTAEKFEQLERAASKEIFTEDDEVVKDAIKQLIRRKIEATRTWLNDVKYIRERLASIRKGDLTADDLRNVKHGMPDRYR